MGDGLYLGVLAQDAADLTRHEDSGLLGLSGLGEEAEAPVELLVCSECPPGITSLEAVQPSDGVHY